MTEHRARKLSRRAWREERTKYAAAREHRMSWCWSAERMHHNARAQVFRRRSVGLLAAVIGSMARRDLVHFGEMHQGRWYSRMRSIVLEARHLREVSIESGWRLP